MSRTCRSRSRPLVRTQPVAAAGRRANDAAGRVFVLRADLISAEARALSAVGGAGRCCVGQRGALAEQLDRVPDADGSHRHRSGSRAPDDPGAAPCRPALARSASSSTGSAASPSDGREYVTILGPGQSTPAPWINVIANPASASRSRPKAAATPGRSTAARTSSRPGRTIRSPIGRARRSICATRTPASSGARPRCRSATTASTYVARHGRGYSRFEHDSARHRARSAAVRAARRSDQDLAPDAAQPSRPPAAPVGHGLCRMGARPLARRLRALHRRPRSMPRPARCLARNPWNAAFGSRVAFADLGGRQTAWTGDRARIHRPQRHARQSRRRLSGATPLSRRVGAGLDPCGALQTHDRARARTARRDRLLPRPGRRRGRGREP